MVLLCIRPVGIVRVSIPSCSVILDKNVVAAFPVTLRLQVETYDPRHFDVVLMRVAAAAAVVTRLPGPSHLRSVGVRVDT